MGPKKDPVHRALPSEPLVKSGSLPKSGPFQGFFAHVLVPQGQRRIHSRTLHAFLSLFKEPLGRQQWVRQLEGLPEGSQATEKQLKGHPPPTAAPRKEVAPSRGHRNSVASATSQLSSRSQKDALRHRIFHLSELLRVEKTNRDDNTSCYVELVSKADREKAPSIRQTFERINQRSSANIAHLEQRLQDCWGQLKKLEQRVFTTQDSSASTSSTQPQLFTPSNSSSLQASFNISRIRTGETVAVEEVHLPPLPESQENCPDPEAIRKQFLEEESKQRLQELNGQLLELREDHKALEDEWHKLDESWKADKQQMMELLQEEKRRYYHLEVQVNDVIQINLNEITNVKQDLACTEEKMVYQSYERSRDIWEVLDSYQTRLTKLETQQQTQQQEAMELPQASVYKLYGQLMNLLLTIAAIFLVCVSTVSACALPLLRTRWRAIATVLVVAIATAVWNYFPEIAQLEWLAWLPLLW